MNFSPVFTRKAGPCLFVLLIGSLMLTIDPHPAELQGNWTIYKEVGFTPVADFPHATPLQLRGSELKITHRNIEFQDRSCNYRIVEKGSQTPEEFFRFYDLETHLALPVDAQVLQLECDDELQLVHLLTAPENLWFMWYGVLLEAAKNQS